MFQGQGYIFFWTYKDLRQESTAKRAGFLPQIFVGPKEAISLTLEHVLFLSMVWVVKVIFPKVLYFYWTSNQFQLIAFFYPLSFYYFLPRWIFFFSYFSLSFYSQKKFIKFHWGRSGVANGLTNSIPGQ